MSKPDQRLIRNICASALRATKEFGFRRQRVEVAIFDEGTISVKLFNVSGTSETFTVTVNLPNH